MYPLKQAFLACLVVGIIFSPGYVVGEFLRRRGWAPAGLLTDATIGPGIWMAFLFICASLHILTTTTIVLASGLWFVLVIMTGRSRYRIIDTSAWTFRPWRSPGPHLLALSIAFTLGLLLFNSLDPIPAWDADTYHLAIPRLYLENHGYRDIAWSVYAKWPMNVQLLYGLALALGNHVTASAVHFAFLILTLGTMWRLCSSRRAALLAAAFLLANPVLQFESTVAYVDVAFAFFMLAGFVFLLRFLESDKHRQFNLIMSGTCCGILIGVKVTGFVGASLVLGLLIYELLRAPEGQRLSWLGLFVVPALFLGLPWFLVTWHSTGNPFYPFLWSQFGGPHWSAALGRQFSDWHSEIGMGREPGDWLLLPVRMFLQGGDDYRHFDGRLSPVWIGLLPLAGVVGVRHSLVARCLLVAVAFWVFWAMSSQQARLIVAVLPFMAVAAAVAMTKIIEDIPVPALRRFTMAVVMPATALLLVASSSQERVRAAQVASIIGRTNGRSLPEAVIPPMFRFINEKLPRDSRILFLNTNRGFFCRREYVADSFFEASQVNELLFKGRTVDQMAVALRDEKFTHVLLFTPGAGVEYPFELGGLFSDRRYTRPVYRVERERMILYALVP